MMSPDWQDFLRDSGAVIQDGHVCHFGNPALETQAAVSGEVIADLSHRALIAVQGADAAKFLQGQLTNDIGAVTDGRSQISAYCSPKGRTLAIFRVFRRGLCIYLALPDSLLQATFERLRKYILMSKVTLVAEAGLVQMGYSAGPHGLQHLAEIIDDLPDTPDSVTLWHDITVIRIPGPHPRFEFIGPEPALKSLWTRLDVHAAPVGVAAWELLDIHAGLPSLAPETVDAFTPQMLNLDLLGGINFKKGCYTGQEIVARTHYLGKLKRRTYRLHCTNEIIPASGTPVFNSAQRSDEAAGSVICAQTDPTGGITLLAVLHTDTVHQGELHLGNNIGPLCTLRDLPYSLEETTTS